MNYASYLLKTLLRGISILAAVAVLTFVLSQISPVDPVETLIEAESPASPEQRAAIAAYWGLYDPPLERFVKWAGALLHGDMGVSAYFRQPVADVIRVHFANSLLLMSVSWVLSGVIGFVLGVAAAAYRGSLLDRGIKTYCLLMASAPAFWVGLLVLMVFAVWLDLFPIGLGTPIGVAAADVTWGDRLYHLVLPALTLSLTGVSQIALHTRQKLMDVLASDYVLFAKARDEHLWGIIRRHGLRNILLPAVTLQFGSISEIFGGSVLVENVFSYTGLGQVAMLAGTKLDLPLLMGVALCSGLFVFVGNMTANLLYPIIDPRIAQSLREGEPTHDC